MPRLDLKLAAVARAGIDFADRQAAAEHFANRRLEALTDLLQAWFVAAWQLLGEDTGALDFG
jgi:hypothetical protein